MSLVSRLTDAEDTILSAIRAMTTSQTICNYGSCLALTLALKQILRFPRSNALHNFDVQNMESAEKKSVDEDVLEPHDVEEMKGRQLRESSHGHGTLRPLYIEPSILPTNIYRHPKTPVMSILSRM